MNAAWAVHRPQRAPVPPIDPLAALDLTHREVLLQLRRLQDLIETLQARGADTETRAIATELCDFFGGCARQHHAEEEERVFPLLLERGDAELQQQVRRLQQDHGWLEEDWLELGPQLATLAAGYSGFDTDVLREGAALFAALYLEHIALEEGVVYPAARAVLAQRQPVAA